MKIKEGFVLREVAGQTMVIPTGKASESFTGMVRLNETGKYIWESVEKGISKEEIISQIAEMYGIANEKAKNDVNKFVEQMKTEGFLD